MNNINSYLINYRKTQDKEWFEKIYYIYMPRIYNFFYFKLLDNQASEDLSSEVFIKVYKNLNGKKFNDKSFNVWIYKIAKNHLVDYFRKNKLDKERFILTDWDQEENLKEVALIEDDYFIKNSNLLKKEFVFENEKVILAMDKLTKLQKSIVILMFVMDFDYRTIANILGKRESTIRGILFRAMKILKSEIKDEHK